MTNKETTAEIIRRLRLVPDHRKDISMPEFRWCAGLAGSRRADAFFIQSKPPYFTVTYEIKVERWDFQPKIFVRPRGKNDGGEKSGSCPTITSNSFQQNTLVAVCTPEYASKNQNGRLMKDPREPSFTLTARDRHGLFDGRDARKITPLEEERLQGFPDGWTALGASGKKMSDSVRYKALGNAVSTVIPEAIGRVLFIEEQENV